MRHKRQAPKCMNKFSYFLSLSFSLPHHPSTPSLSYSLRFPVLLAVKSIFPKISWENAETEAKHHTQWYKCILPPAPTHNTTPSVSKLNTLKISYFHFPAPHRCSSFEFNPVAHRSNVNSPIEESDEAHSWMSRGWLTMVVKLRVRIESTTKTEKVWSNRD